jgi:hypothetical protein
VGVCKHPHLFIFIEEFAMNLPKKYEYPEHKLDSESLQKTIINEINRYALGYYCKELAELVQAEGIYQFDANGRIWRDKDGHKQQVKLNKLIYKYLHKLGVNLNEHQCNKTADYVRSALYAEQGGYLIDILHGQDIIEAYVDEYGGHSCMTGEDRRHRVQFYGDHPDKIGLAVCSILNKPYAARCLIWDLHKFNVVKSAPNHYKLGKKSILFADRIYSLTPIATKLLTNWAEENTQYQRWNKRPDGPHVIECEQADYDYPYFDTMQYKRVGTKAIITTQSIEFGDVNCRRCNIHIWREDGHEYNSRIYCEDCYNAIFVECGECSERVDSDNMSRVYDSDGNEIYVCEDCVENYTVCANCGEYNHQDMICTLLDDQEVCQYCVDNSDSVRVCHECEAIDWLRNMSRAGDELYCSECYDKVVCEVDTTSKVEAKNILAGAVAGTDEFEL